MTYAVTITGNTSPYLFPLEQADGRIIFHYGVLGPIPKDQDPKQPKVLGPYHVKIAKDGLDIFDADISSHWWNARWTYYPTTSITVQRTPAQLVAANRMFPFGDTGNTIPAQGSTPPYFYMGSSNITIYMPTTGERPDIGLLTDNSAYYMLGANPSGMIAWALCGNTCPMHYRDQNTGRPIDLLQYYGTNAYDLPGYQGSPWLAKGEQQPNGYCEYGGGWAPQQAHYCEMSYVAYQATRNPSFLEDLQYSANFTVLCDAALSGPQKKPTISGEYRGVAWAFRNLFMAHVATLDAEAEGALPDGCMTSDYWKSLLDIQLAYYSKQLANPANQTFRLVTGLGRFGPWQVDYMLTVLAFGVLTGHSDWTPLYLWALKNAIDRNSNELTWQQGGFPPGWGTPYYLEPKATWYDAFLFQMSDPAVQGPTQAQVDALKLDPLNGGKAMQGREYFQTTRAALVMADYLDKRGLAPVRANYPQFDAALSNAQAMFRDVGYVNPRVSVISEGIIMPSAVTINLGQKVHLDVTFTGPKPPQPPTYTQSVATVGTLSNGDMAGVLFTSTAVGKSTVTAACPGATGPLTAACEVTVTSPLPTAIALTPGVIS